MSSCFHLLFLSLADWESWWPLVQSGMQQGAVHVLSVKAFSIWLSSDNNNKDSYLSIYDSSWQIWYCQNFPLKRWHWRWCRSSFKMDGTVVYWHCCGPIYRNPPSSACVLRLYVLLMFSQIRIWFPCLPTSKTLQFSLTDASTFSVIRSYAQRWVTISPCPTTKWRANGKKCFLKHCKISTLIIRKMQAQTWSQLKTSAVTRTATSTNDGWCLKRRSCTSELPCWWV